MATLKEGEADATSLRPFLVLECVMRSSTPPSLDDITRMCGLPKPTVFRILGSLQSSGLLQREPISRCYSAGARLTAFAMDVVNSAALRAERNAILRRLVDEIGETCNFTMLDGNQVLYLDRVETSMPLRLHLEAGIHVPLHCTASGKLFLSQLSPKHVYRLLGKGPYQRWTPNTITDPQAMEEALKRIRHDMVGTDNREADPDSVCVAVPVMEAKGRVYAAVAVHGPASRMTLEKGLQYVPAMRCAADAISKSLVVNNENSADRN
ncbi:IclR family transcriptional regulator [Ralstonia condita]|nr:IclR family transcriptional regulator [Ralstonia sp. LMG 7141]